MQSERSARLTNRGQEVLIEGVQCAEAATAEVTLIRLSLSIPSLFRRTAGRAVVLEESVRDVAIGIALLHDVKDLFAINVRGFGAGSTLEVVNDPSRRGEGALAEGTRDGSSDVHMRAKVLVKVICAEEGAVAVLASEHGLRIRLSVSRERIVVVVDRHLG